MENTDYGDLSVVEHVNFVNPQYYNIRIYDSVFDNLTTILQNEPAIEGTCFIERLEPWPFVGSRDIRVFFSGPFDLLYGMDTLTATEYIKGDEEGLLELIHIEAPVEDSVKLGNWTMLLEKALLD